MFKANLGTNTFDDKPIIDRTHPGVVVAGSFAAAQGLLPKGLIVALDGAGAYVPYDPAATDTTKVPKGVLVEEIDTAETTVAGVVRHGTVVAENLLVGDATATAAAAAADISALADITIYAI
ncbi:MAG: head decoration protein [Campylobacterota bacterium]